MSKHTSESWIVRKVPKCNAHEINSSGKGIATTWNDEGGVNARLIAAAPKMFGLLKDIRDWVEGEGESFQYSEELKQVISEAEEV